MVKKIAKTFETCDDNPKTEIEKAVKRFRDFTTNFSKLVLKIGPFLIVKKMKDEEEGKQLSVAVK